MRNTRTAAACLAATTLFGLLAATPAPAEPAPTPTTIAPTPTAAAPEPTPTAIAPTPVAAAPEPAAAPTPVEPAPGVSPSAQQPFVIAELSDEGVLVSLSDDLYRSEKRFVVIVEGKPVAQIQNKRTRGVLRVVPDVIDGRTVLYIPGVKQGDRMAVTEYAGSLDDGFDDTLRRTRLYTAQLGDAAPTGGQPAPVSTAAPTPGPVAGAGTAKDAPVVTVSYEDRRAVFSLSEDVATSTARVWISVNGVKIGSVWNDELTGLSGAYYSGHRLYFTADAHPGDQVKVTLEGGNGSGVDEDAPERVLFEGTL
ncbi:hypothetical protein [Rathayibacter festucae]|uniref:hypothetical protein n=1 Tax=Rathayibacter festucae TaxID=110937 RepID=UPI002A69A0F4|nr:hypothetical protein [Rathayibacter festucae]MDY0914835.1 hypothetical protein [Rathayibacter festucae]